MRRRHDNRGATLSLVVVTTLVIMVLGMGIFFLTKLLGGARELQNATDSGNLNVAKQSLRTPDLKLFPTARTTCLVHAWHWCNKIFLS